MANTIAGAQPKVSNPLANQQAGAATQDFKNQMDMLKVQQYQNRLSQTTGALSAMSKRAHDTMMSIIRNLA